jgi:hypothetical protein
MANITIFVEGQTELVFVERFLNAIFDYQGLHIELQEEIGKSIRSLGVRGPEPEDAKHNVVIVNCNHDGRVLSAIVSRAAKLHGQGVGHILGLRDLFPISKGEMNDLYLGAAQELEKLPLPSVITIAVMEIEAWFLSDTSHLAKIDPALTVAHIQAQLGIDLNLTPVEDIAHPSNLLHRIYALVGGEYRKKLAHAHQVTNHLDYDFLYLEAPQSVPSLGRFVEQVNAALT